MYDHFPLPRCVVTYLPHFSPYKFLKQSVRVVSDPINPLNSLGIDDLCKCVVYDLLVSPHAILVIAFLRNLACSLLRHFFHTACNDFIPVILRQSKINFLGTQFFESLIAELDKGIKPFCCLFKLNLYRRFFRLRNHFCRFKLVLQCLNQTKHLLCAIVDKHTLGFF